MPPPRRIIYGLSALLLSLLVGCVPPSRPPLLAPPSEEALQAQAMEDCRYYRLSPYLAPTGEEACLQRRLHALHTLATLQNHPAFPAAQEACAFLRGGPTEERCYQRYLEEARQPSLGAIP